MKINIWNIYASSWNIWQFRVDQPIIDDAYIFCVEMNYALLWFIEKSCIFIERHPRNDNWSRKYISRGLIDKHVIRIDCVPVLLPHPNDISLYSSLHFIVDKTNMFYLDKHLYIEKKWRNTTGTIDTHTTQIHDHCLSRFGTGTSVKGGWVKLVL